MNGNASNVDRQITKERGYADSTTANYAAMVISAGAGSGVDRGYFGWGAYGSTTSFRLYLGDSYVDDTSNGGYGTISGGPSDTSVSARTSGQEANWLIMYDTTDGEEFFTWGPTYDARDYTREDGFAIIKRTSGDWMYETGDGAGRDVFSYTDDGTFQEWSSPDRLSGDVAVSNSLGSSLYVLTRFNVIPDSNTVGSSISDSQGVWIAANPSVLGWTSSTANYSTGDRLLLDDLGDGTNVFTVTAHAYGPRILVDLS